ncbi:MAG: hypothetical protein AB1758_10960, partial [Candidatus Eremiobacterota bacterium]
EERLHRVWPVHGTLTLTATGVPVGFNELTVRIRTRGFPTGDLVTLTRRGDVLEKQMDAGTLLFETSPSNRKSAALDWSRGSQADGDSRIFLEAMKARSGPRYGFGRTNGRSDMVLTPNDPFDPDLDEVDIGKSGIGLFESAGYALVIATVEDPALESDAKLVTRLGKTANVVYLSGHGSYVNLAVGGSVQNLVLADRVGPEPADAFKPAAWRDIDTLVVAGCVACNLNDYAFNNQRHVEGLNRTACPPSSPARTLRSALGPGAILLGYQDAAPEGPWDQAPVREFFRDMGPGWVSQDATTPLLWMRANERVDVLDNAAALDSQFFYFFQYSESTDPPRWDPIRGWRQRIHHTKRRLVKVPQSDWDLPSKLDHHIVTIEKYDPRSFDAPAAPP